MDGVDSLREVAVELPSATKRKSASGKQRAPSERRSTKRFYIDASAHYLNYVSSPRYASSLGGLRNEHINTGGPYIYIIIDAPIFPSVWIDRFPHVKHDLLCMGRNAGNADQRAFSKSSSKLYNYFGERLTSDISGPLPTSINGYFYLV